MSIRWIAISSFLALAGCQTAASPAASCAHVDGMVDGPHVPDEATARAIAQTIADRMQGPAVPDGYNIEIEDEGHQWIAYQYREGYRGGGVAMNIAKCDGSISRVHFQR